MIYSVYVLLSLRNGKRYVGFTGKTVADRLREHNIGVSDWTRQNGPFELKYCERYANKQCAMRREKFLKSGQGRKWLDDNSIGV
jgi:putative endonuclease